VAAGARSPRSSTAISGARTPGAAAIMSASLAPVTIASKFSLPARSTASAMLVARATVLPNGSTRWASASPTEGVRRNSSSDSLPGAACWASESPAAAGLAATPETGRMK
jgi:hypothetical protein